MRNRVSFALRPSLNAMEGRLLTTTLPVAQQLHARMAAAHVANLASAPRLVRGSNRPVIAMFDGPGQGALPNNYQNWGAISVWNTTTRRITFSASASTYRDGRYFNFTLRPGQHQTYYAAYDQTDNAPLFRLSFDPINKTNPVAVGNINTIYERLNWYPRVGTEGRPYAIAIDVSGYYLTPI